MYQIAYFKNIELIRDDKNINFSIKNCTKLKVGYCLT
jgi:hypothetical protein